MCVGFVVPDKGVIPSCWTNLKTACSGVHEEAAAMARRAGCFRRDGFPVNVQNDLEDKKSTRLSLKCPKRDDGSQDTLVHDVVHPAVIVDDSIPLVLFAPSVLNHLDLPLAIQCEEEVDVICIADANQADFALVL